MDIPAMGQDQGYAATRASKERETGTSGKKYDNRSIMNGILWIAGNGAPWRELPERYGKWQAVYAGFRLWTQRGILEHIFTALREDVDMEHLLIDFTFCKVHQCANGGGKMEYQAVGVSNGGRNTKIHA